MTWLYIERFLALDENYSIEIVTEEDVEEDDPKALARTAYALTGDDSVEPEWAQGATVYSALDNLNVKLGGRNGNP